jgi:Tfp pilus assembly protein PilE
MDTSTIVIAVISIAVMSLPFTLSYYNSRKKQQKLVSKVQAFASEFNNSLERFDTIWNGLIALDAKAKVLFFYSEGKASSETLRIPLADQNKCEVILSELNAGDLAKTKVIETVSIRFSPKSNTEKVNDVVMFDGKTGLTLNTELNLARDWVKMLNELM